MSNNLTDAEVKKALECCHGQMEADCINCPNEKTCGEIDVVKSVIDLINRYEGEIKKLEKVEHYADKTIESLKAEIERLKETTKIMSTYIKGNNWGLISFVEFCKNLKAEAYKECIEKVKKLRGNYQGYDFERKLNNLLNELVGK